MGKRLKIAILFSLVYLVPFMVRLFPVKWESQ